MKALILNSGVGSRLMPLTKNHPKCMTQLSEEETILSLQLKKLSSCGIREVVMTTGYESEKLIDYGNILCRKLGMTAQFVFNNLFNKTNYIYSIYLAEKFLHDDILLLHGDLVFDLEVLQKLLQSDCSRMIVSSTTPLPQKDFKALIIDDQIKSVGIDIFENAVTAQPFYKLLRKDWEIWLSEIIAFCRKNEVNCYAENAFNQVSAACNIYSCDVKNLLCMEIDNLNDYEKAVKKLNFRKFVI